MEKTKQMMKKGKWFLIGALVLIVLVLVLIQPGNKAVEQPEPAATATVVPAAETEVPAPTEDVAETPDNGTGFAGIRLAPPMENPEAYVHEQLVTEAGTSEKYYLVQGNEKKLLYSIDFGTEKEGNWLGMIELDTGDTPISYTIYAISDEEMAMLTEEERANYSMLMSGMGTVLDSIMADSRFSEEKVLPVGEEKEAQLTYWSFTLPGNMSWTETEEDGSYQAVFYGSVGGEQVALYTVHLGEPEAQTVLGRYNANGTEQVVSVESFDLTQHDGWTEDDYSTAYRMMDTINLVIETIMAGEQFVSGK